MLLWMSSNWLKLSHHPMWSHGKDLGTSSKWAWTLYCLAGSIAAAAQLDIQAKYSCIIAWPGSPSMALYRQLCSFWVWDVVTSMVLQEFLSLGCTNIDGTPGISVLISVVQCRHAPELPVPSSHKDTGMQLQMHKFYLSFPKRFTLSLKFESMFLGILTWQDVQEHA